MAVLRRTYGECLNVAGKVAWRVGSFAHHHRLPGLWLCGLAGTLDAMADETGIWDGSQTRRHW